MTRWPGARSSAQPTGERPALHDLYADLCEHHAADVARNAIVPDASFDCEAEPTEPDAAIAAERAASEARIGFLNAQMLGNWLARAGR